MTHSFTLVDALALRDLQVYFARAARIENGGARLVAASGVLAVYVPVLTPAGILDTSPTVLGLRTFGLFDTSDFDEVVDVRAILERLAHLVSTIADDGGAVTVELPAAGTAIMWTSISPPRGGWAPIGSASAADLEAVAKAGIDEVAAAIPAGTGEQIVHRVRSEVWGRPVNGFEHVPAGAAFAALSLGFLGGAGDVAILEAGSWTRLSTDRGHVLVKRRASALAR